MDTFKALIYSRVVQVVARLLAVLLAMWGAKAAAAGHDPGVSPELIEQIASGLAQFIGAGALILFDLFSHRVQKKSDTAPVIDNGPNLNGIVLILLPCVLVLGGCMKPPPAIAEGRQLTRTAYLNVADNEAAIIEALITGYRAEANARIDAAVQTELKLGQAAAGTSSNTQQTMDFTQRVYADRDAKRIEVDQACAHVRQIVAQARKDLVIAAKLEAVLDQYENAGVDIRAAGKAVSEILSLMKTKAPVAGAIVPLK